MFDIRFNRSQGEVTVDQAHRGYSLATDAEGYRSSNPLFMKYTPTNGTRKHPFNFSLFTFVEQDISAASQVMGIAALKHLLML
jgi:D-galacturonate reductase